MSSQDRQPNRVSKGTPTGGQFAASARAESSVSLDPTEDDLDFARETLGPDATDDEVHHLAEQRLDRDAPEMAAQAAEAPEVDRTFFPLVPLTPRDVEHLVENRGRFQWGYDSDAVNSVLSQFQSARLVCVWAYYDDAGYGGDSEFFGIARGSAPSGPYGAGRAVPVDKGSWRDIHPDVWEYLSDPDTDIDPETIPSLLSDDVAPDAGPGIDHMNGDGFSNLAIEAIGFDDDDDD